MEEVDDEIKAVKEAEGPQERIDELTTEKLAARKKELQAIEWKPLWAKPAIFAGAIMVLFILLFHDKVGSEEEETPAEETPEAAAEA